MNEFSPEAKQAIDLIKYHTNNVFITGKAGTGKSTLLNHIVTLHKNMVVLASTGIAAINVSGQTIHSFFGLKPGYELDEAKNKIISNKHKEKFKALKYVVIDEVSMVRPDVMDAIDTVLRRALKKPHDAFGGIRMIFIGDLFQLPPVVSPDEEEHFYQLYRSSYFFSSNVIKEHLDTLSTIELVKIYRQSEQFFIDILNRIRENEQTSEDLKTLNKLVNRSFEPNIGENYIHIMTTNKEVNDYNTKKLEEIDEKAFSFKAEIEGDIGALRPNDIKLTFKKGAQVMMITNNHREGWANGSMGTIVDNFKEPDDEDRYKMVDVVVVKLENGRRVYVKKHEWEISEFVLDDGEFVRNIIGSFTQMPLKLAWAVTVHKSQGKTFNKVVVDLGRRAFAHGQTYVALSRCTSTSGLVLKRPVTDADVIVDPIVLTFFRYMKYKKML